MITSIELTDSGTAKFNAFMGRVAKPGVRIEVVLWELNDVLADRAGNGESLVYELGRQHTTSGNPETLTLNATDVSVSNEAGG